MVDEEKHQELRALPDAQMFASRRLEEIVPRAFLMTASPTVTLLPEATRDEYRFFVVNRRRVITNSSARKDDSDGEVRVFGHRVDIPSTQLEKGGSAYGTISAAVGG